MNLNDRANEAYSDSSNWFPKLTDDLGNTGLCLAGEVGEVCNLIKKVERGTHTLNSSVLLDLVEEVIDVQTYLYKLMGQLTQVHAGMCSGDLDWEAQYDRKRMINEERFGV